MKTTSLIRSLACAAGLSAVAATGLQAQLPTATTKPLGYYTIEFPAGSSLGVVGLVSKNDFCGESTGLTAAANSTITQTGATWTPNGFATGPNPTAPSHYMEITEAGTWEGLTLDIVANTADTLTVDGDLAMFFTADPGEPLDTGNLKYCIRAHATLGDLFPGGAGFEAFFDQVNIYNADTGAQTYLWSGASWVGGTDDYATGDDTILRPGQGAVFVLTNAKAVVIGGNDISAVKESPTLISMVPGAVNIAGFVNPLVQSGAFPASTRAIDDLNLAAFMEPFFDNVTLYAQDGSLNDQGTYLSNGATMVPAGAPPIDVGNALVFSVTSNRFWQAPPLLP